MNDSNFFENAAAPTGTDDVLLYEAPKKDVIKQNGKRKFRRKEMTLMERIQLITKSEGGFASQRTLASEFGVSLGTVNNILHNKEKLLSMFHNETTQVEKVPRKRRHEPFREVNRAMEDWLYQAVAREMRITGPVLKDKAKEFALALNIDKEFKASNGWLDAFVQRYNVQLARSSKEQSRTSAPSSSSKTPPLASWVSEAELRTAIKDYHSDDVYAFVDISLLYQQLPQDVSRYDLSEPVLRLILCCSFGGQTETPFVILSDPAFQTKYGAVLDQLPVSVATDRYAYITPANYVVWLNEFNKRMEQQQRRILLLVPQSPVFTHSTLSFSHIKIQIIGSNVHRMSHPLLQGPVQLFKAAYRIELLQYFYIRSLEGDFNEKQIDLYQVLHWIGLAWERLNPSVFRKAFRIVRPDTSEDSKEEELYAQLSALMEQLPSREGGPYAREYAAYDDQVQTQVLATDENWEQHLLTQHLAGGSSTGTDELVHDEDPGDVISHVEARKMLDELKKFAIVKEVKLLKPLCQVSSSMDQILTSRNLHWKTQNEAII